MGAGGRKRLETDKCPVVETNATGVYSKPGAWVCLERGDPKMVAFLFNVLFKPT